MKILTVTIPKACLFACLAALLSCEMEPEPESNTNNGNGNNTADSFTPDELSGFLVLKDAARITGELPVAPDLQLKINVKDTIYSLKGLYGAMVVVRHDGLHDISGFYIAVSGGSSYYNVPVEDEEAQGDSTVVFYIDADVPENDGADYPFTIPIRIQPYDQNGEPLDEFVKLLTIENPETGTSCSIAVPFANISNSAYGAWKWMHTLGIDASGSVFHREAPDLLQRSTYITGGCCNDDGSSTTVAGDPYCFSKFSDGTPNPRWRSIEVSHYFLWVFDMVWFYDNGDFKHQNLSHQTSYRPSKSDFCNEEPHYEFDKGFFWKYGTHDFTPGSDYLTLTYTETDPPVYGKTLRSGELLYDCNGMALIYEVEGQTWIVEYRRTDPEDFHSGDGSVNTKNGWD